jgi:hypothetical protein
MDEENKRQPDKRIDLANERHDPVTNKSYREVPLNAGDFDRRAVRDSIRDPRAQPGSDRRT